MGLGAALALLAAGCGAGLASTIASLASVVSYPALLALGLRPIAANVTNTVALVFTAAGAAAGSRPELKGQGRLIVRLGLITATGGAAGAALLLLSPPQGFAYAAPFLIAAAALALLARPVLARRSKRRTTAAWRPDPAGDQAAGTPAGGGPRSAAGGPERPAGRSGARTAVLGAGLFGAAVYIGYFGAAGGIVMLAVLTSALDGPLARLNAVKNVVSGLANAAAAIGFAVFGPVRWAAAIPLAAGFLIGGRIGPVFVRRLPQQPLRVAISVAGLVLAAVLAVRTY